ncbi:MAG: alanine racemase, partial [Conexibacter sp.]|nr:alanine racemase [Conexibacter sp.]
MGESAVMSPLPVARAEIVVDLSAIRHNVRRLREHTGVATMTVVKADGFGHGLV